MSAQLSVKQSLCLLKTEEDPTRRYQIFFSLCDGVSLKVSNRATFQGNRRFCKLRRLRQMRPWNFQNEDACIRRIAAYGLHRGVDVPS